MYIPGQMAFASTSGNHFVPVLLKSKASVLRRRSNKIWSLIKRITIWVETTVLNPKCKTIAYTFVEHLAEPCWSHRYLVPPVPFICTLVDREVPGTPRHTKTSVAQWNSRIVGCSSIVWRWARWRLGLGAGVGLRGRLLIVLALCWNSGRSPAHADFS